MKTFRIVLWGLFTLGFLFTSVALIGQNQEPLTVELFSYVTPTYPKWVILLSSVFIGAVLSAAFFVFELIILETRNVRLRRANQKLERALAAHTAANAAGAPATRVSLGAEPRLGSALPEEDV
jgi:uncharacterized integral membrane protein